MDLIRELLSRSTANGSRTNALQHLQWMVAAFLAALLFAAFYGLPIEITILLSIIVVIFVVAYLATHTYFMTKNPDALRSEKFTIQKMAIERGLIGDSTQGMRKSVDTDADNNVAIEHSDEGEM